MGLEFEVWPREAVARFVASVDGLAKASAGGSLTPAQVNRLRKTAAREFPDWGPDEATAFVRHVLAVAHVTEAARPGISRRKGGPDAVATGAGTTRPSWWVPEMYEAGLRARAAAEAAELRRRTESVDWRTVGDVLKVRGDGRATYVTCRRDGVAIERDVRDWDATWRGSWRLFDGGIELMFGPYELVTRSSSIRADEYDARTPITPAMMKWGNFRGPSVGFVVLPVVTKSSAWRTGDAFRRTVVKFPRGRIAAAEIRDGGVVSEYDLLRGWDNGPEAYTLGGEWSSRSSGMPFGAERLRVRVGEWDWQGRQVPGTGFFQGREAHRGDTQPLDAVVALVPRSAMEHGAFAGW